MNSICHQKQFKLSRLFTLCFAASVAMGMAASSGAATLGHSRLVSGMGQPLRIHIPIKQITANELASLNVSPATQQQWQQSGLTPPVDLSSLSIGLIDGASAGSHVLVVSSQQIFNKQIADLLLDVKTDSGTQAYQVSILAQNDATVIQAPSAAVTPVSISQASLSATASATKSSQDSTATGTNIVVQPGDNMFAIAKRNATANVSVYQLMIALQRANPSAFINDNINLVKSGATLTMPDSNAISAISDSQARKIFHQQVLAFKQGFSANNNENIISTDNDNNSAAQTISDGTDTQSQADTITDPQPSPSTVAPENNTSQTTDTPSATQSDNTKAATPELGTQSDTKPSTQSSTDDSDTDAKAKQNESDDKSAAAKTADELKLSTMINGAAQGIANSVSGAAQAAENSDVVADTKVATDKAVEYTKDKISQLEENVKNLNEALTAQGSAASEAIIEGALEIQKALTDDESDSKKDDNENTGSATADGTDGGIKSDAGSGVTNSGNSGTSSAASSVETNNTETNDGQIKDGATSESDSSDSDSSHSSQSTSGDTSATSDSSGDKASSPSATDSTGTDSSSTSATDTSGTQGKTGITSSSDTGAKADSAASTATTPTTNQSLITPTDKPKAWFKKYFLGIAGGLIGFIILVIVWVLRRSYVTESSSSAAVTPEMVQEKLNQIDLNLDEPSIKDDKRL